LIELQIREDRGVTRPVSTTHGDGLKSAHHHSAHHHRVQESDLVACTDKGDHLG
jgi:hypothetical protein